MPLVFSFFLYFRPPGIAAELRAVITARGSRYFLVRAAWATAAVCGFLLFLMIYFNQFYFYFKKRTATAPPPPRRRPPAPPPPPPPPRRRRHRRRRSPTADRRVDPSSSSSSRAPEHGRVQVAGRQSCSRCSRGLLSKSNCTPP